MADRIIAERPTIFVDMDGVLCDFITGVCNLIGRNAEQDYSTWPEGEWDFAKVFGFDEDEMWKVIDKAGAGFWRFLPWHYHAQAFFENLSSLAANRVILSSPSRSPHSYAGKRQWAIDRLPLDFPMVLTKHKYLLAKPDTILVDDSDKNVSAFRAAGGWGVLFQRPWNRRHSEDEGYASVQKVEEEIAFSLNAIRAAKRIAGLQSETAP